MILFKTVLGNYFATRKNFVTLSKLNLTFMALFAGSNDKYCLRSGKKAITSGSCRM